jgi:putative colanic acid biosynthesis UDP-glucose lipid carrier transferase
MKKDDQAFSIVISNYPLRYCAKPGITGMAQVKGFRGPAVNFFSIFHRYQWDAFYIRNARPALDLKILRLTAHQVLKGIFSFKTVKLKQLERMSRADTRFLMENLR